MNILIAVALCVITIFTTSLHASEVSFELGQTQTINNYFQIPNNVANRIDLPRANIVSFRLRAFYKLNKKYDLYALIAPLELEYNFQSNKAFNFDGQSFQNNQSTKVKYKFNSYRLGFIRKWNINGLKLWAGAVIKVRDARILVNQSSITKSNSNVGFVPQISLGAQWFICPKLSLFTHTDILGASQGYAYDTQLEIRYWFLQHAISLGYRSLGGGADNDKLKNFSQFNTAYAGYTYSF